MAGREQAEPELDDYVRRHNAEHLLIVNIESRPAIEALDDIVQVPGLDAVLIGPHDLSCSLGVPEQYDHPLFDEAVLCIVRTARDSGKGAGIHFSTSLVQELGWIKAGANMVVHSSDLTAFSDTMRAELLRIRQETGECVVQTKAQNVNIQTKLH
ncbi:aldolase/citrate lyase family protein [Paenibacillus koleovorans]|uniref:aldolase/citrate lyase family protein n=1 Tax=Paenibacillus koleovorans TaxID=121608 RepID=UPI000FD82830|nr:aldolase/citrate lyase family protein [Paenibacillus koleovorans]